MTSTFSPTSAESVAASSPARRLAVVVARYSAASGTPPGIDRDAFAAACLADSYELLADLVEVSSGVAGEAPGLDELLWPGAVRLAGSAPLHEWVADLRDRYDEVVMLPADVPDLPGLVVAKVFKALQRAEVCLAPERAGGGLAALGVRVPWPEWLPRDLDLDVNPVERLLALAPGRNRVAVGPDWHRLRNPAAIGRLDPGLEGWETTRSLLSGRALSS
jgi:hypothetical protein